MGFFRSLLPMLKDLPFHVKMDFRMDPLTSPNVDIPRNLISQPQAPFLNPYQPVSKSIPI
ncbi:hypothetical protein PR048_023211 [Dryococelus australis]|uniref:BESS domain-containing protein n=1 Tax=Dryococelus australis TaxID=614101 RepID=A0ABQ9GTH9_9NEOP|nr:hypothetical protein PR048_023211 [Dryococelus australis]